MDQAVCDYFISCVLNSIFKAICDDFSYHLLRKIVENDREVSNQKKSFSFEQRNQFSSLIKAGLIKENQGKFLPTSMGVQIYDHMRELALICDMFQRMRFIDRISTMNEIPQSEVVGIIDLIIKNSGIRRAIKENMELPNPDEAVFHL